MVLVTGTGKVVVVGEKSSDGNQTLCRRDRKAELWKWLPSLRLPLN